MAFRRRALLCTLLCGCGGETGRDGPPVAPDAAADADCLGAAVELSSSTLVRNQAELDALRCVQRINGSLLISGTEFVSLRGLERLTSVYALIVSENSKLTSLEGLEGLSSVGVPPDSNFVSLLPSLAVRDNAELRSLRGLEALEDFRGRFDVCGNPQLLELPPPRNLGGAPERISILYNQALDDAVARSFADGVAPAAKVAANGNSFAWTPVQPCPWAGDGVCDESMMLKGDVWETCDAPPCCEDMGPTALCVGGSDGAADCRKPPPPP
jgi:hypothetical protein